MSETTEIRTQLALTGIEQIRADLAKVSSGLGKVDADRSKTQSGFKEWLSSAHQLMGVLGVSVGDVVTRIRGFGEEFVNLGAKAETGDQSIAALIATAQGVKIDAAIDKARDLGDTIDDIAIGAGISGDALGSAFQIVLERTGATEKGVKAATDQIDHMAIIASKLGKNVEAVAGEFAFMEEGQLKTKGQLFQLLQTTGIFGKDTKKAAEAWAALTDAKRSELLAYGLGKLSGAMKAMPPTFDQTRASFENMLRISKEQIGEPIIRELTPALQEVTDEIIKMGPEISELGRALAKDVGAGVREGGRMFRDALVWLKDHKAEIAADLKAGAQHLKDAVAFVVQHKEAIGIAVGAYAGGKAAAPLLKPAAGFVGSIASAGASGAGGGIAGTFASGTGGAIASLGAFSAAVIGVGLAADQGQKLLSELKEGWRGQAEELDALGELAARGETERVETIVRTMRDLKGASGELTDSLNAAYEAAIRQSRIVKDMQKNDNDALRRQIALGSKNALVGSGMSAYDEQAKVEQGAKNQVAILANAYNTAVQSGNKEMALLAAQTIAGSQTVAKAFLEANVQIEGGLDSMAETLLASGGQFAGFATSLKGKAAGPPAPKILMPGAKITVNQDFKNRDPDNVAVLLKRGVARGVDRKLSARYGNIFGG